jgi:pimeloyl-ACP methyl ester carboxylesterase
MNAHSQQRYLQSAVKIPAGAGSLNGILNVPPDALGIVLFAHGSGSSRLSTRNQYVAGILHHAGLATLLFDLLTDEEAESRENVFDIELLAERLEDATIWQQEHEDLRALRLGYFGASTGAAAALVAASRRRESVAAVVSRGGRPDLAMDFLPRVKAPTLLLVGGHDQEVLQLNQLALAKLPCEKQLTVVPGATHLFPEPGALRQVANHALRWFALHLDQTASPCPRDDRGFAAGWTQAI